MAIAHERGWRAYHAIKGFIYDQRCRRRALLDHFGDSAAGAPLERCCDVCDGRSWLPDPETIAVRRTARGSSSPPPPELAAADAPLFEELKAWRLRAAAGKPAYTVANNRTLTAIAATRPRDERELLAISGVGPAIIAKVAAEVLAIVAGQQSLAAWGVGAEVGGPSPGCFAGVPGEGPPTSARAPAGCPATAREGACMALMPRSQESLHGLGAWWGFGGVVASMGGARCSHPDESPRTLEIPRRAGGGRRRDPRAGRARRRRPGRPQRAARTARQEGLVRALRHRRHGRLRPVLERHQQAPGGDRVVPHLGLGLPRLDRSLADRPGPADAPHHHRRLE
ncbi:MAG: HRDC domain-containing protein [Solirubrobacterales bacterium]